jgi:7-cyano-7-deazaguanine reductase
MAYSSPRSGRAGTAKSAPKSAPQSAAQAARSQPERPANPPALAQVKVGTRTAPATPPTVPSRQLDVFPNPAPERDYLIQFHIPEFTCNCPLTGQPDFANFTIDCIADRSCIELKSLKLYMWSYRHEGAFHEKVTNDIAGDIVAAIDPRYLRITAKWNVRGGIVTHVVVEHRKKGWKPLPAVDLPAAG